MIVALWEHLRETLHFLTRPWLPVVPLLVGVVIVGDIIRRKRKSIPVSPWDILRVAFCVVAAVVILLLNLWRNQVPDVSWQRVTQSSPATEDLRFLDEVTKGLVPPEAMMTPHDRGKVVELRKQQHYQDNNNMLNGSALRAFESGVTRRCPHAIAVRGEFHTLIGVYVVRDGQAPNQRLAAVDSRVELPRFSESWSEYRLVVIAFAFDDAAEREMARADFKLETKLDLVW